MTRLIERRLMVVRRPRSSGQRRVTVFNKVTRRATFKDKIYILTACGLINVGFLSIV